MGRLMGKYVGESEANMRRAIKLAEAISPCVLWVDELEKALAGIGGLSFTVAAGSGFSASVAGYGFLALAVMIFGNWKPLNILGASLFFALFKVIGSYSSAISFLPKFEGVVNSGYIYNMLPYIVTMIILILTSKNSAAPKAEGIPYDKGQR